MQLVLVSSHLIQFELTHHIHMHYYRTRNISLLDAYVCSGYFAALALPADEIEDSSLVVTRPYVKSEPRAGAQMPLFVKRYCS